MKAYLFFALSLALAFAGCLGDRAEQEVGAKCIGLNGTQRQSICVGKIAGDRHDINICQRAPHLHTCVAVYSAITDEYYHCLDMEKIEGPKDLCITYLAAIEKNKQICEMVDDQATRDKCVSSVPSK